MLSQKLNLEAWEYLMLFFSTSNIILLYIGTVSNDDKQTLKRATLGGHFSPLPLFHICQTNGASNAKLAVPLKPSILHTMCQHKFRTYHRLATNASLTSERRLVRTILVQNKG